MWWVSIPRLSTGRRRLVNCRVSLPHPHTRHSKTQGTQGMSADGEGRGRGVGCRDADDIGAPTGTGSTLAQVVALRRPQTRRQSQWAARCRPSVCSCKRGGGGNLTSMWARVQSSVSCRHTGKGVTHMTLPPTGTGHTVPATKWYALRHGTGSCPSGDRQCPARSHRC